VNPPNKFARDDGKIRLLRTIGPNGPKWANFAKSVDLVIYIYIYIYIMFISTFIGSRSRYSTSSISFGAIK